MTEKTVRILLVEDNPLHAKLVRHLIESEAQADCLVSNAGTLAEALEALKGGFDLVLLDLVLPDSQELETLNRIRAADPSVPVVILTGLDDVKLAAKAVESGADDFLIKTQLNAAALNRAIQGRRTVR